MRAVRNAIKHGSEFLLPPLVSACRAHGAGKYCLPPCAPQPGREPTLKVRTWAFPRSQGPVSQLHPARCSADGQFLFRRDAADHARSRIGPGRAVGATTDAGWQ